MRWLNRDIAARGPYLTLCTTEKLYREAMRKCKVDYPSPFIDGEFVGEARYLRLANGERVAVVSITNWEGRDPIVIAGLLVHEATHVWQQYKRDIGEQVPGDEQEAYAIQILSQTLMDEFVQQTISTGSR